jgi:3D-(3,5/4)-trihydroxycyclohexane-1,2-dione acylhydrolase (decyclizing)
LVEARGVDGPVVIHIETDRYAGVPSYEGWWDVPVAEVSEDPAVKSAREQYERAREAQRTLIAPATQREVAR